MPRRPARPSAAMPQASPGYFTTIGTRLLRGRAFTEHDSRQSPAVVVVNDTLARVVWPGEDPIGKRIKQGWPESPGTWREVVGVVAEVNLEGVGELTPQQVYMPIAQVTPQDFAIVVRTAGPPADLTPSVERIVRTLDGDVPTYSPRTMDEILAASLARERMSVLVLMVFALVALTLASVGLYGVVAHAVTERTHEIGVRMALGAEAQHVVRLVMRQGLSMTLLGSAIGVAGALGLSRSMQGLPFVV